MQIFFLVPALTLTNRLDHAQCHQGERFAIAQVSHVEHIKVPPSQAIKGQLHIGRHLLQYGSQYATAVITSSTPLPSARSHSRQPETHSESKQEDGAAVRSRMRLAFHEPQDQGS